MLVSNIKKILKIKNQKFSNVTLDDSLIIVDANDPSIKNPSKYIGQRFPKEEAEKMAEKFDWTIKEQNPGEWRQVVPSPLPQYIEHGKSIQTLVNNAIIVIASGGGGIPAFLDNNGNLEGLDAERTGMVGLIVMVALQMAEAEGIADSGYRLVINQKDDAGQLIDHLHLHVLGGEKLGRMG